MRTSHNLPRLLPVAAAAVIFAFAAAPAPAAQAACPNEQLRADSNVNPVTEQPYSAGLPECRAYEMVSPLEKQANDAKVEHPGGGPLVSPDGEAVGFFSVGAFAGAENFRITGFRPFGTYIARRTTAGWVTESAYPPVSVIGVPTDQLFGGDVSLDLATRSTCGGVGDIGENNGDTLNLACAIRDATGTWIKTPTYTSLNGEPTQALVLGSSSDLSDIVWTVYNGGLLPGAELAGSGSIYETTGLGTAAPQLRMVNVNNEGTPLNTDHGNEGPLLGAARFSPPTEGSIYQAISADGNTIYFEAEPAGGGAVTLYARTGDFAGGTPSAPTTVTIAAGGTFAGASADGSKVFFTTDQALAATDKDSTSDLYEYNFDAPAGQRYTQVSAGGLGDPSPGSGAQVKSGELTYSGVGGNIIGISSDGSHVCFSSRAMLTTLPNGNGEHAGVNGGAYCYDTETGETKFVGAEVDNGSAQLTPDGRYLVFTSTAHLSPEDVNSGSAVYRYDFQSGEVTWISHAAPGFPALDEGESATLPAREEVANGRTGASAYFADAHRAISENGAYIAFTTAEKLQANDVNHAPDVYEWHEGAVHLISDGQNSAGIESHEGNAEAPGISASGSDIVFTTDAKLVGQDTDSLHDVYDARINGGFPAPAPEPSCAGEACQGAASALPTFGAPGSVSFTGGANLIPPAEEAAKPATGKVKITGHAVRGTTITLTVQAPGKGRLTVSGAGLKSGATSVAKAGAYKLRVALTAAEQKLLKRKRKATLKVRVGFTPTSGSSSSATVMVTVRQ